MYNYAGHTNTAFICFDTDHTVQPVLVPSLQEPTLVLEHLISGSIYISGSVPIEKAESQNWATCHVHLSMQTIVMIVTKNSVDFYFSY